MSKLTPADQRQQLALANLKHIEQLRGPYYALGLCWALLSRQCKTDTELLREIEHRVQLLNQ